MNSVFSSHSLETTKSHHPAFLVTVKHRKKWFFLALGSQVRTAVRGWSYLIQFRKFQKILRRKWTAWCSWSGESIKSKLTALLCNALFLSLRLFCLGILLITASNVSQVSKFATNTINHARRNSVQNNKFGNFRHKELHTQTCQTRCHQTFKNYWHRKKNDESNQRKRCFSYGE